MKTPKSKRIKKRACGIAAAVFILLMLCTENWNVVWRENGAAVTLSGEEQEDAVYVFCFDGTVEKE